MSNQKQETSSFAWKTWIAVGVAAAVILAAALSRGHWLPEVLRQAASLRGSTAASAGPAAGEGADGHEGHAGHTHEHAGHDEIHSLELSPKARKNIGLETGRIKLRAFVRTMSVPAMVTGRPGRSEMDATAPLGGRVTRIYAIEGEAVEPGQPLFDLRLTHEELVRAQSEFLRSAEELDVVEREIRRMQSVSVPGAIPGKRLLERQYEKQKIEALINAQRQSLLLHGLTPEQITGIFEDRQLLQGVTVATPAHAKNGGGEVREFPFIVQKMHVKAGQYVDAGAPLCTLFDYGRLYIQGRAFEQDGDELLRAAREQWPITAVRESKAGSPETITGLHIVYVENEVEADSRALYFYVGLPNKVVHTNETPDGHRFLTWKYKAGQRMQLLVPVERWEKRIVLPVDAVAREGPEYYVFQQNGDHFDRIGVHVEYQDQLSVVIANDGTLFPGDTVAMSGAHQLQMALKNKSGGPVDPHAGHHH